MLRLQISLTESERRLLDAEAARTGLSISALIPAAVESRYGSQDADLAAMCSAFGSSGDREADLPELW